jgi:hypothetical protein
MRYHYRIFSNKRQTTSKMAYTENIFANELTEPTEEKLSEFIHDLFMKKAYLKWRKNLKANEESVWHSLIASLAKNDAPLEKIKSFGENIYPKLVFNYVKAPDFKDSQMLMIQFTVSGTMWHSLIWHCPERN